MGKPVFVSLINNRPRPQYPLIDTKEEAPAWLHYPTDQHNYTHAPPMSCWNMVQLFIPGTKYSIECGAKFGTTRSWLVPNLEAILKYGGFIRGSQELLQA
jgi:hypothetical protein